MLLSCTSKMVAAACSVFCLSLAMRGQTPPRVIDVDVRQTQGPVDRFFDLSVGSDYPGHVDAADDSQAQLKTGASTSLGFRYIRFHAIFHDVLGTVRVVNGKHGL